MNDLKQGVAGRRAGGAGPFTFAGPEPAGLGRLAQ